MTVDSNYPMADIARASGTSLTTVNNFLSGLVKNAKARESIQRLYPKLSSDYLFGSEES